MTFLARLLHGLRSLFRRIRADQECDDELRDYLETAVEQKVAAGMSWKDARRLARVEMGGVQQTKERARDIGWEAWAETLWQDARLAMRSLRRTPVFTVTVIATLALGIGANTAIFSLMDAILLRPLPVRDPGELWQIYAEGPAGPGDPEGANGKSEIFPWPLVERFQRDLPTSASLAAMTAPTRLNMRLGTGRATTLVSSQLVSGGFFRTFGLQPALGRLLTDDDMRVVDGHPVAVIGHGFWERQFGRDPHIVGRMLPISGVAFTIVGVAPPDFRGVWDSSVDVWVPLVMQHAIGYSQNASTNNAEPDKPWASQVRVSWLDVVVRTSSEPSTVLHSYSRAHTDAMRDVAEGSTEPWARAMLARQLKAESFARGYSITRFQYAGVLRLLMAMVALLLLIACANVANLFLARWSGRRREVGIRLSIGAGRARLVRQLLAESVLLGTVAGAIGFGLAAWISGTLAAAARLASILPAAGSFDVRVFVFCLVTSLVTTILCGLVPAWRATAAVPANALRTGDARSGHTTSIMRPLVSVQIALSVVLVVSAALLSRSLLNLSQLEPGYDREHLVQIRIDPLAGGIEAHQLLSVYQSITQRARLVPGVLAAEVSRVGIASGRRSVGSFAVQGYEPASGESARFMNNHVGPTYLATTGMTLVKGRTFNERDMDARPPVAIVNELAAQRYLGGVDDAIGKRVGPGLAIEIVGIVRDARTIELREAPMPMVFLPLIESLPQYATSLDVRVAGNAASIGEAVRRTVAAAEPRLLADSRPTLVGEALDRGLSRDRLSAGLAAAFGGTAILLACIGLYGVLAYAVGRRTHEMGVRVALGASSGEILGLVVGDGLRLALVGAAVGTLGAAAAAQLIESLLFGVRPLDLVAFVTGPVLLTTTALLACLVPAIRAARVNPVIALRCD